MYRILIFSFISACGALRADTPPPELLQAEIQELQSVIRRLREKNQKLENRNGQLVGDILNLGRQIQALRRDRIESEASATDSEPEVSKDPPSAEAGDSDGISLLYVNPHWHYVILNQGADLGIEVGDYGSIFREGRRIAVIKVTDTKPGQSIAELDLSSLEQDGVYPSTTDAVEFR